MTPSKQPVRVDQAEAGMRLDRWLKRHYAGLPQSRIENWARQGHLRIDGQRISAGTRLLAGQDVQIPPWQPGPTQAPKSISKTDQAAIRAMLIYQDPRILVLNKPAGLAVQGGSRTTRHIDAMTPALIAEDEPRPRLVHRLDRDTSGVLVLARNAVIASELAEQFRQRRVQKLYWALTPTPPSRPQGRIETGLIKRRSQSKAGREIMQCVPIDTPDALHAITDYQVLANHADGTSWLALSPQTGRTHQLRAHMARLGCPILGDGKYGPPNKDTQSGSELGLCLHARSLSLPGMDPISALPPSIFAGLLQSYGFDETSGDLPFPYRPEYL